jgi:hypothetical protein
MIENLPLYIVVTFVMSTLITVGIFQYATKRGAFSSNATKFLSVLLPFWLIFQATISVTGFYKFTDSIPPRLVIFGIAPALLTIIALFIFAKDFILRLPLQTLTIIHIVRIPVELVLHWLYQNGQVPQLMTYEGVNFDILSGITAPIIYWFAFRGGRVNKPVLLIWNFLALGLLLNIVIRALLSFPSPLQQLAFEQPNRAIIYFPFIWLPTVVVPIVLFSHLTSIWQLFKKH